MIVNKFSIWAMSALVTSPWWTPEGGAAPEPTFAGILDIRDT